MYVIIKYDQTNHNPQYKKLSLFSLESSNQVTKKKRQKNISDHDHSNCIRMNYEKNEKLCYGSSSILWQTRAIVLKVSVALSIELSLRWKYKDLIVLFVSDFLCCFSTYITNKFLGGTS